MNLVRATDGTHKWTAVFDDGTRVSFGAVGYQDYTQHKDRLRRANYLSRHRARENWNDPKSAGALSRWILWNTTSFERNVSLFRERFGL